MRLLFSLVVVGIFLSFLPAYEADATTSKWELDLENGYISTKPLVVEENVIAVSYTHLTLPTKRIV